MVATARPTASPPPPLFLSRHRSRCTCGDEGFCAACEAELDAGDDDDGPPAIELPLVPTLPRPAAPGGAA